MILFIAMMILSIFHFFLHIYYYCYVYSEKVLELVGLLLIYSNYDGSPYNVTVRWANGEITDEPLFIIATDAPVVCAIYAKKKKLLSQPRWKCFKRIAKQQGKMFTDVNKIKLRSQYMKPKFKYGIEVPRIWEDVICIDTANKNTSWQDTVKKEMDCMKEFSVFIDIGSGVKVPNSFKNICVHMIYDVKHDGRHRARFVADGHLTDIPSDSVYSGVSSERSI